MQQSIDTPLIVLSLILIHASAAVFIFYRPKDLLPHTYDPLKWIAFISGLFGTFILANYVTALCCLILAVAYPLASKQCYTDIDIPQGFAEIVMEGATISILAWVLSFALRPIPFSASILVLALIVYFICRVYAAYYRAEALRDSENKKYFIGLVQKLSYPLSHLLCGYHPDCYPPPVNRVMARSIAQYATAIRDLDKANGIQPDATPDHELIRLGFMRRTFPESWDYERTSKFCQRILAIADRLKVCAELPLDVQAKYETEINDFFDERLDVSRKAEDRLPPEIVKNIYTLFEKTNFAESIEAEMELTEARLTALIPDYIAKTKTVIGTPPEGLPVAYESLESRYRHTFLIGRSGAGKSTVITNLVAQDIHKGYGVIVMSPDEDLMRRIVPYIPEHRLDDVIYFDPTDTTFPMIGFNPFYFESPDNSRDYQLLKSRKAGETYTILERTLGLSTQEGMQTLLNNAMHALIGRPTASINELHRLLNPKERALQREVANDPDVDDYTREYWESYAAGGANALVYGNLTRRMANLLRPPLFDIFSTHSLSFHREINERARIILLDLSNFPRDSMEAKITSQLMIATVQQTILRRDKIRKEDYIPYFMYIDEFQNFADTNEKSIGDMAEQLRKYSFGLTLTSLVASDLSGRLFDTIIGVMSTFICLSMSAKDARRFADEMSLKRSGNGEFSYDSLQKLKVGQAFVKTPPSDTAVFVQMPREPIGNLPKGTITLQQLKNRSKANFGAIKKPSASLFEDGETENELVDEPLDIPPATEPPRSEPPTKTPPQPTRSKTLHQTPVSDSPNIAPKTQPEREADLFDTPPAPEPPAQNIPPKKEPTRPAKRKKRNRFDEDVGEAEIEVF
jgi:hypothetical protein